ncbi:hydrolase [Rhizobium sp. Root73]|nr:hydrolase [Rhizobium sp. Root1334]KRC08770.1 hydrolase [Rhizobium sp. Root73]
MRSATITAMLAIGTSIPAIGEIEAPGPQGALRGTMILPAQSAPMILIIPGSGPTDRDGNNPQGVKAAPYRLLAEGLGEQGIGSVRIDKRGMFGSHAAVEDPNAVTVDDYVQDAGVWIDVIRSRTGAGCVWLLGHSEGGLVALAAAERLKNVCGVILVATAGRPLGEVLREQLSANADIAHLMDAASHAIDELSAGRRVDASQIPPELSPLFGQAVQNFLISTFALDPADLASKPPKPILIMQGERDLQVSVADAKLLNEAAPHAKSVILPDTNHVLKTVGSNDRNENIATYFADNLPLAPGVVDAISRFVKTH